MKCFVLLNFRRCKIDQCEDANSTAEFPRWWPDNNVDRCSKPVLKSGKQVCTNNSFTGDIVACEHWIYENNNTIISEVTVLAIALRHKVLACLVADTKKNLYYINFFF